MKVTVVGVGYVGLVAAGCLAEVGNHVVCVDNDAGKIEMLKGGRIPIYEPGLTEIVQHNERGGRLAFTTELAEGVGHGEVIVLAVGTPSSSDGSADISAILEVAGRIAELMREYRIVVTKSTVPVGTYAKATEAMQARTRVAFDYVSNPEFLKEGAAVEDFMKPARVIIGTNSARAREALGQLYAPFMRKSSRALFMDPASAEMTKYAANAMLATRISFMNELSGLCEAFGADIELVRAGVGSDERIGKAFLFAGLGYGGSCFPKDVRALRHMGRERGVELGLAAAVEAANARQQERFARRVTEWFGAEAPGGRAAVWGLSFKARTDDVRESPALYCVERFLAAGLGVRAYDPEAMVAARGSLGASVELCATGYEALEGSDALVICTDWQEFRTPDFEEIRRRLRRPVIFDGRNLYDPAFVRRFGIEYHSIGRA